MNTPNFAKPGEKNVIDPDYKRKVTIKGTNLLITLSGWIKNDPLEIRVDGKGSTAWGWYRSRKTFGNATWEDFEALVKKIRLEPCRKAGCDGRLVAGNRFNPKRLCYDHQRLIAKENAEKEEAKRRISDKTRDAIKKENGYRYKAVIWIHRDDSDDYSVQTYFRTRPRKIQLAGIARKERSRLLYDFTVMKL